MKCSEITYKKVSELVLLPENPRTITKNDFERWYWQETNA